MSEVKLDILAFGAHPDDVELSCAGTIVKHVAQGKAVGIVDLTRGELGSRGSAEIRLQEAQMAAKLMGLKVRVNLEMADGFFEYNKANQLEIIQQVRRFKPDIVLCNAVADRHPDHGKGSKLVADACFLSGLVRIETEWEGQAQEHWRPKAIYHYIQDRYCKPDLIVDITEYFGKKMEVILAYKSQFYDPKSSEPHTPISSPEFLEFIKGRSSQYGRLINAPYGEGYTVERTLGVDDLTTLK